MDELCIRQLRAINLREMLVRWVPGLLFEEARHFVPNRNFTLTVDHFVTHVQGLEGNHVNELSLYADRQIQRQNESTFNLLVQNTVPQRQFGQPLTEVDILSDSSSSSSSSSSTSSFVLSMRRIPFGSSPTRNTTITQSIQGDSEEVAPTPVQPENSTRNEVQEMENIFLPSPIGSTIIQPSQGDSEEVAPSSVQPEYIMVLVEVPMDGGELENEPSLTTDTTITSPLLGDGNIRCYSSPD